MKRKNGIFSFGLGVWFLLFIAVAAPILAQETEVLRERVSVVNCEMLFRAYMKGKLVTGLQKEDFVLLVNGRPTPINGFFEKRKKIAGDVPIVGEAREPAAPEPRLFVLIFNISDYKLDLEKNLEYFFDRILGPNDRLMIISNQMFQNDHVVLDPKTEKGKVQTWLKFELSRNRQIYMSFRQRLISLLDDTRRYMDDIGSGAMDPEEVRRLFIDQYRQYLKEYKQYFLSLNIDQYINLADYLRRQKVDKWVFNFFEINNFFVPALNSILGQFLSGSPIYHEMRRDLEVADNIRESDIGKYFINSGATFHSLFMTHRDRLPVNVPQTMDMQLERQKIASDSENVFAKVTKLTGGVEVDSNDATPFYKNINKAEDVYYVLTFVPEKTARENRVKLLCNNKDCRLVYDDRNRSDVFDDVKARQARSGGEVRISDLQCDQGMLRMKLLTSASAGAAAPRKIRLRVLVVKDYVKTFFNREKTFDVNAPEYPLQIKLPNLSQGNFHLVIEATDLESEKNDVAFLPIAVAPKT